MWQGGFASPQEGLPPESREARVELWLPREPRGPVCLHFAATGDQGFLRRRLLALPLLRQGLGALLLESPFYGTRRPAGQAGSRLRRVSDLWALGTATVAEGLALLAWLQEAGFGHLGVAGISRAGQVAALTAAAWPGPLAVAACAAPHSAEVVFTRGLMREACDWEALGGRESALPRLREALDRTDLRRFPRPARPEAAVLLGARHDAYIPPASVALLHRTWPGSALRWLPTGHVGAVLFHAGAFRRAVVEAFARLG